MNIPYEMVIDILDKLILREQKRSKRMRINTPERKLDKNNRIDFSIQLKDGSTKSINMDISYSNFLSELKRYNLISTNDKYFAFIDEGDNKVAVCDVSFSSFCYWYLLQNSSRSCVIKSIDKTIVEYELGIPNFGRTSDSETNLIFKIRKNNSNILFLLTFPEHVYKDFSNVEQYLCSSVRNGQEVKISFIDFQDDIINISGQDSWEYCLEWANTLLDRGEIALLSLTTSRGD